MKCDETKPACQKCTSTGRKCDGYDESQNTQLSISRYSIPFQVPGSQRDRQMLHFFSSQWAIDLSGHMDADFWGRIVLQRIPHQGVVRDAVIALSCLNFENTTGSSSHEVSLRQYTKALRSLHKYINGNQDVAESTEVALICGAMFYCFESARGYSGAAMQHLQNGLTILTQNNITWNGSENDTRKLQQLFARLDLQASMYNDVRVPSLTLTTPDERRGLDTDNQEGAFKSFGDAQMELAKLQNWLFHLLVKNNPHKFAPIQELPPALLQEKNVLEEKFGKWKERFDVLSNTDQLQVNEKTPARCSAAILLIHWNMSLMFMLSNFPHDTTVFGTPDSSSPAAEDILTLAGGVLREETMGTPKTPDGTNAPQWSSESRTIFSAETGIVAPLFLLAMKSSRPTVVARSLGLLGACRRHEGLYHSDAAVSIAESMTKMPVAESGPIASVATSMGGSQDVPLEFRGTDLLDQRTRGMTEVAELLGVRLNNLEL